MRVVIAYESMFGNTKAVAEAIARGFDSTHVCVYSVADERSRELDDADLIVVGGPTHAWSMSRPKTRAGVPEYVRKSNGTLTLEPGANSGPGVRDWLRSLGSSPARTAAFDTRFNSLPMFTGRASVAIAKELTSHGMRPIVPPESFLVDKKNHLLRGELDRARAWGVRLDATLSPVKKVS